MSDPTPLEELVGLAAAGDRAAWDVIVTRFAPLVWSIGRRHRLADDDLRDVGATVWLRLVERLGELRDPRALPGWIATTTRRECVNHLRRTARDRPADPTVLAETSRAESPASDEWLLQQERRDALRAAFAELGERCARLLRLLFTDPRPEYVDIAAELDMPVGSIGPTRARCLGKLRSSPALTAFGPSAGVLA